MSNIVEDEKEDKKRECWVSNRVDKQEKTRRKARENWRIGEAAEDEERKEEDRLVVFVDTRLESRPEEANKMRWTNERS